MQAQQVEFFFVGPPMQNADSAAGARTEYAGFNLNGVEYKLGDCAFLYPEDEGVPPYLGRILSCFHDRSGSAADAHCVEVAWYERRSHLESDPLGKNWEREVVALEETDVNPIGCISGKAVVFTAGDYDEASRMAQSMHVEEWLFCRGVYRQCENCVVPFPELAEHIHALEGKRNGKRNGASGHAEGVADSDEVKRQRIAEEQPAAPVRRTGKLVSGRTCVECGATQTPQWREGPAGPKTLCNACGVRYVRAQQRANKRAVPVGPPRSGYGSGGRQSRNSKAAKAETASARAARAGATAAVATEEAPHRPQRQAALMAASKTAQYARTGIFPLGAAELAPQSLDGASGLAAKQLQQKQQQLQEFQQQQDADVVGMGGAPGAAAGGATTAPGTPTNCSSNDFCGNLPEDVTVEVEVVVGPADGDAGCCGSGGGEAAAAAAGPAAAAAVSPYPLVASSTLCLPPPPPLGGALCVMVPADQAVMALAPTMPLGGGAPLASLPHLPASAARAAGLEGASAGLAGLGGHGPSIFCPSAPDCRFAPVHSSFGADLQQQQQPCPQPASEGGAPAALSGGCCDGVAGGAAAADCVGVVLSSQVAESSAGQVVSAPVSPSVRMDDGGGFDSCGSGGACAVEGDVQLRGYGCGLDMGLDDEYGSLVAAEVDFGLGLASADGCLFDQFHQGGPLGCEDDEDDDMPFQQPQPEAPHQRPSQEEQLSEEDRDGGVLCPGDLPEVAARLAPFCPELAPGTDARELLDSVPVLAQAAGMMSQWQGAAATGEVGESDPADTPSLQVADAGRSAADSDAALPEGAVAQLVALGRQASRAATEAMAADAALQAVSQVLEAHQEAARKARDAAVAKLGRLKDCISTLAGGDALVAAAEMGGGHLIELRGRGDAAGGGGVAGMAAGGCCCPFDATDMVVAVHS